MWITQEPKKVALRNKRHFEEKNGECAACLKYSVLISVEKIYIKCNIWKVAVRPSYIQDAQFLKVKWALYYVSSYTRLWADGHCSRHVTSLRVYLTTVWLAQTSRRQMMGWFSGRIQKEAGEIYLKAVSQTLLGRTQGIRDQFPGLPVMATSKFIYSLINGLMLC